ncbi:MAG: DUF2171 domain-containing protein [Alphaproteobacteria bacterium]|nr:MAG: DUF2171 domain-containing protein [Alphaproteobacteria bacterium]
MADRYSEDRFFGPEDQYVERGVRTSRGASHSSAHDYAAAGLYGDRDDGQSQRRDYREHQFDRGYQSQRGREPQGRDRDEGRNAAYGRDQGQGRDYRSGNDGGGDRDSRGFFERAGDEVRAWFGDEDAERRRERDNRYDEQYGRGSASRGNDPHYSAWRRERVEELDRDYDEYRREHAQRFHNEFSSWRTERQGQREGLNRVAEHMEVIGSDGSHIGTVDKVRGDRIILTKNDSEAGGHHHSIPSRWIETVSDKVTLRKTADEAKSAWKDEDRGALFNGDRDDSREWRGDHNLDRAFRGTY